MSRHFTSALVEDDVAPSQDQRLADERRFILDPDRSTLERLAAASRDRFLTFAWQYGDFPGGPPGVNEGRAEQMFNALTALRPERRANSGSTAVVSADEFGATMQARVREALVEVPGERGLKLHREAADAYVRMRTAAAADGVTLAIHNSYRPPEVAQANAAKAGNRLAVASFSSHTLGLAIDLRMSHGGRRYLEVTTRPFQNLVDMYKSPVHKWMFLRGEAFGWYPYRREPWHWEYNPQGFRDRFRDPQAAPPPQTGTPSAATTGATPRTSEAEPEAMGSTRVAVDFGEKVTDPVVPPRSPLVMTQSVGRGGRNLANDVRAVQDRLMELRAIEPSDAVAERPSTGAVTEQNLAKTIDAIERFQRDMGLPVTGRVEVKDVTRTDLDRAIRPPTPDELTAVTAARTAIPLTTTRGLTLTGAVGATDSGNAPDDVRALQQRLVDLGVLSASHGESPAAPASGTSGASGSSGTGAAVPQARLRSTIAALRKFQGDVAFWRARGTISGATTPGVAAPGDATTALLDRVSAYRVAGAAGAPPIVFHDHVASRVTQADTGVMFVGAAAPSAIGEPAYAAVGLSADQAAALRYVSTHEGNFDAINTYDRARVSVGFIQFAGGRGLPPYLALLKARQPAKFRDLLQRFGIDVEFVVTGGAIRSARVIVLDPASSAVLRAAAAETAIRDDKRLSAALILSGRDRDVQLAQIEAAVRDYVLPALNSFVSWAAGRRAKLGELLRSRKGMACLFDRAIQEGVQAAQRRFERIVQRVVPGPTGAGAPAPPTTAEMQRREGDILAELERDLQAAADVAARLARARADLQTLIRAAAAAGASLPAILARPELAAARRAVFDASRGVSAIVNVSTAPTVTVDATLATMTTALAAEETRLALTPPPASTADLAATLSASHQALGAAAGPVSTATSFLTRIQRIRRSTMDSRLTAAESLVTA